MSNTLRDPNQILKYEHDEKNNAKRVIVVNEDLGIKVIEKIVEIKVVEVNKPDNSRMIIYFFISQLIILALSKILS